MPTAAPTHSGHKKRAPDYRPSASQRGYGGRWQRLRANYLARHPLCEECLNEGRTVMATVVDHIDPHRGDKELFYNEDNWQSLCTRHHNSKTGKGL